MTKTAPFIDFAYVDYNNLEEEYPDIVPVVQPINTLDMELLFHSMTQEQLEIIICLYLGLKTKEIVELLEFPNEGQYRSVKNKLHVEFRKKKRKILAYNKI